MTITPDEILAYFFWAGMYLGGAMLLASFLGKAIRRGYEDEETS